jgi:hypothetical protein
MNKFEHKYLEDIKYIAILLVSSGYFLSPELIIRVWEEYSKKENEEWLTVEKFSLIVGYSIPKKGREKLSTTELIDCSILDIFKNEGIFN